MAERQPRNDDGTHDGGVVRCRCCAENPGEQVLGQLSQVTDHVRVIQETTNTTNELLKYRIEEAFTDIQRLVFFGILSRWLDQRDKETGQIIAGVEQMQGPGGRSGAKFRW